MISKLKFKKKLSLRRQVYNERVEEDILFDDIQN